MLRLGCRCRVARVSPAITAFVSLWASLRIARNRPVLQPESGTPVIGVLFVKVHQARNLKNKDLFGFG